MSRSLTQGETSLGRDVFQSAIDYGRVRVHDGKYIFFQPDNSGMTPNGEIYVHGIYRADYAAESPQLRAFFIHEMVHVWQYQVGVLTIGVRSSAIWETITRLGDYDSAYPYVLDATKDLTDYGLEQQASIIEDYYRLTRLALHPHNARMPSYTRVCTPNQPGTPTRQLYERVLRRFLSDPAYGHRPYQRVCSPAT